MTNCFSEESMAYVVDAYLNENYDFRRNVFSGKTEMKSKKETTGSRRYLCISIPEGELIDNDTPIDYDQLYAQVMHEIDVEKKSYWLTNAEEKIVQDMNMPYLKIDSMETMLHKCFRKPKKSDADLWMSSDDLITTLRRSYPIVNDDSSTRIRLGATLKSMGYASRRTRKGRDYNIVVR